MNARGNIDLPWDEIEGRAVFVQKSKKPQTNHHPVSPDSDAVAVLLFATLKQIGMTFEEAAKQMNIHPTNLSRWRKGAKLSPLMAEKIKRFLAATEQPRFDK